MKHKVTECAEIYEKFEMRTALFHKKKLLSFNQDNPVRKQQFWSALPINGPKVNLKIRRHSLGPPPERVVSHLSLDFVLKISILVALALRVTFGNAQ